MYIQIHSGRVFHHSYTWNLEIHHLQTCIYVRVYSGHVFHLCITRKLSATNGISVGVNAMNFHQKSKVWKERKKEKKRKRGRPSVCVNSHSVCMIIILCFLSVLYLDGSLGRQGVHYTDMHTPYTHTHICTDVGTQIQIWVGYS